MRPVVTVDREALGHYLGWFGRSVGGTPGLNRARDAYDALKAAFDDAPAPGDVLDLDGEAILLDHLGVALARTTTTNRLTMVLDLGGAVSGSAGERRVRHRYIMPPAVGAELVVALLQAGREEVSREAFLAALDDLGVDAQDAAG